MKSEELKKYTIKELQKLLNEKRIDINKLKIDMKTAKTNAVHTYKNLKKEVARILTELNNKQNESRK